ncbi:hypothetical protein [Tenacibaculum sp. 190524A05c]|uniref:DUF5648 domain-containing protein n=1 Tax=Tenacibaculum platacis TaxID=3137852 RepID=A0ABP1EI20_9FLAO
MKVRNLIKIIAIVTVLFHVSCSNDELNETQTEQVAEKGLSLEQINAKVETFLADNSDQPFDKKMDEKLNNFIRQELEKENATESTSKARPAFGLDPNSVVPIYRFYKDGDHFYTKSFSEGQNAGFAYEGVLGLASTSFNESNFISRWYSHRNYDRVIAVGQISNTNHYAIANDCFYLYNGHQLFFGIDIGNNIQVLADGFSTSHRHYWQYEGIIGGAGGNRAIHGYYNHDLKDHLYTNNYNELGAGAHGYVYEGVLFYLN